MAGDPGLLIVQHLLLGINAHVNHDLPQAVVAVADKTGDLQAVNPTSMPSTTSSGLSTDLLRDLDRVSRWASAAGAVGGGRFFNFSLVKTRDQAWSTAVRLFPLDEAERAREVAELDRLVSVLAYLVTKPGCPASCWYAWPPPRGPRPEEGDRHPAG